MHFGDLALKHSGHDPHAKSRDAGYLRAPPDCVGDTATHFPHPSAQTSAWGDSRIAIRKALPVRLREFFRGGKMWTVPFATHPHTQTGCHRPITSQTEQDFTVRNLLQQIRWTAESLTSLLLTQIEHFCCVCESMPICSLRH